MSADSITSVSNVNSAAAKSIVALSAFKAAAASSLQESMETAAQTKTEALQGDQQAVRKLARLQVQNPQPKVASPSTPEGAQPTTSQNAPETTGRVIKVTI
jgi:hypothetical protein